MPKNCKPSFLPTASLEMLHARAAIVRLVRQFFDSCDFLEVETPILSRDTVVDRHLEPFEVRMPGFAEPFYLQTSPEFAMKRLLAAGATAIFQIGHVFRAGDRGKMHNPEFTMLEWYRVGDCYEQGIAFLSEFCHKILCRGVATVVTLRQLFAQHVGLDPHIASCELFQEFAFANDLVFPESFGVLENDRDDWIDFLFSEAIQPKLGHTEPVIVTDYPATQSQLAKTRIVVEKRETDQDLSFSVAERFELFVDGIELANGYHELLDAEILQQRIFETNLRRVTDGKKELPESHRLLEAMRYGLPPCCGTALGLDRLVMAALKTSSIDDVIPFPQEIA
ncbi:MAG: EF-P lysine aminoacylase EpmA [Planctomycetaceae bacterium]|nr:EF-P lysine aminoacylase EpmA [Planctomycetaceae bacterium]